MPMGKLFKRKYLLVVFVFCFIGGFYFFKWYNATKVITIFHTGDIHGTVDSSDNNSIGLARISTFANNYKKQNPNTLLVDAGDSLHGQPIATLSQGKDMIDILNLVKYDATVAGNHDFDYGYQRLAYLCNLAKFPILGTNVKKVSDDSDALLPYIIKNISGVKIAIIGICNPNTPTLTSLTNVEGLSFSDCAKQANKTISSIKGKYDVLIALTHLGTTPDEKYTSIDFAKEVNGVDIIVDGHSHTILEHGMKVNNSLIVQAGQYAQVLGKVQLIIKRNSLVGKQASLLKLHDFSNVPEDQTVTKFIEQVKNKQKEVLSTVIGKTAVTLNGERDSVRSSETNLGDFIADAIVWSTNSDVSLINGGGIRSSIKAGDITLESIIQVLPYADVILTENILGSKIREAIEYGLSSYPEPDSRFLHVGGIRYKFNPNNLPGNKITSIQVNNAPLDDNKLYKVATFDFLMKGGDGFEMLDKGNKIGEVGVVYELLKSYLDTKHTIPTSTDGRISVEK